jgi:predicted DNA-binding protein with PD1-like motif
MRTIVAAIVMLLTLSQILTAQVTRREATNVTTPAEDAKPLSADVPDVYAIEGTFDKVLVLRFKFGTDLLAGLEKMVAQRGIRNAVILSAAGSVRNYHVHSVSNREFPSKNVFTRDPTAPADIVSMNGYVIDGRIHAHLTMTSAEHAFGGHLEPETTVFTFAIITVGVLSEDVDLSRVDDKTYR